jgi:hypothetical protein
MIVQVDSLSEATGRLRRGNRLDQARIVIPDIAHWQIIALAGTPSPRQKKSRDPGLLRKEAERRKGRRAGAALVWNNRETEMSDLPEVDALFFALIGGSPGAEVVFLNQNLAVRLAAVLRDFHAYFLGTLPHRLLDLVDEARDRLRPVELNDDVLDGVGARADPTP